MHQATVLVPMMVLIGWSLVMWIALYATRLPAMSRKRVPPAAGRFAGGLDDRVPATARQVADNYNHLMEQPTLFYATCSVLCLAGQGGATTAVTLAWAYVGLRILHSFVQTTFNHVPTRFVVFVLSTFALAGLAVETAQALT